jgi:hypothetical protein
MQGEMTRCRNLCLNNLIVVNKKNKILNFILAKMPVFLHLQVHIRNLTRHRRSRFCFVSIFILLFNINSFAEIKQHEFIIKQKRFINELYNNKMYFDCIAETRRILDYKNSTSNQDELTYLIDTCYFFGGQYKTVISRLQNTRNISINKRKFPDLFLLSHSYLNIGYINLAKEILFNFNYSDVNTNERSDLFINRVELLIRNFEYQNILSEIENADNYFTGFNSFFLMDLKKDIESYRETGLKSKWLSLSLSAILPGAGQIYSGRIVDGLLSLALVAGSSCGAWYFYKKNDKPIAMTFAFFSCLFYTGNLYGAYNSVENTNKQLNEAFSNSIIKKYNLNYNPADYLDSGIFK